MNTSLADHLGREIAALEAFVAVLQREQASLQQGDMAALEAVVSEKGRLADTLESLAQDRQRGFAALGIADDKAAVAAWFAGQKDPKLQNAWRTFLELAREAQTLNQINGQSIALLSRNNRERLAALTGRLARSNCYGPDGQTDLPPASRISDSV
jgi:flagella synthesis protein FlgN